MSVDGNGESGKKQSSASKCISVLKGRHRYAPLVNVIEINYVRYTFIATVGVSFVYCRGVFISSPRRVKFRFLSV